MKAFVTKEVFTKLSKVCGEDNHIMSLGKIGSPRILNLIEFATTNRDIPPRRIIVVKKYLLMIR